MLISKEDDYYRTGDIASLTHQSRLLMWRVGASFQSVCAKGSFLEELSSCDGFFAVVECIPANTGRAQLRGILSRLFEPNDLVLFTFLLDLGLPFTIQTDGIFFDLTIPTRCSVSVVKTLDMILG